MLVNVESFINIDLYSQEIFENKFVEPRNILRFMNCNDKYGR